MTEPEFHRPHHHDEAREIVTGPKGYPTASAAHNTELNGAEQWWILDDSNGNILTEDGVGFATESLAWENALFKLTQLNAWLQWKAEGEPLFNPTITFADWMDARGNLENPPSTPEPPPTE